MRSATRKRPDGAAYAAGTLVSAPGLPGHEYSIQAPAADLTRLAGGSSR
ncbi:hypothetical protein RKD23_001040 [Streptomyces sp. SAI-170]